ncbi:MAG: phosphoenolpyruvate--protein phosphotransferase [Lachnospiraceae bacterium]|nr:phosphoenolpyruvate--protein phosphotransferase [Lachnospiraceae bacterium]
MQIFKGKRIHGKIGMGPVLVLDRPVVYNSYKTIVKDRVGELERLKKAYERTDRELNDIINSGKEKVGRNEADIFEVHRMLLTDENFVGEVKDLIVGESVCAEYAVNEVAAKYEEFFKNSANIEMQSRAADIKDVSARIIANLMGKRERLVIKEPSIILAEELSPSEVISLDLKKARGIVVTKGSLNSHAAILARSMDIPMVLVEDSKIFESPKGIRAVADGEAGLLIVDPDLPTYERYVNKLKEQNKAQEDLTLFIDKEAVTKSGKKITLYTNISDALGADDSVYYNADGIGLFRTEFLYVGAKEPPGEEVQYKEYSKVLKKMGDKPVIIRTFDLGSDKKADFLNMPKEENPALGLRGIRLSLVYRDLFKTQLKALLRAARHGNLKIMYPMITSVPEMIKIKEIVDECAAELKKDKFKFVIPPQGIMMETPGAVMIAEELCEYAEFFSIGTNDLTQYALAMDRQNGSLMDFTDPYHPAVMRMIEMVVKSAKAKGVTVGICGEMATVPAYLDQFIKLNIDYMSVNPANLLQIRKNASELD